MVEPGGGGTGTHPNDRPRRWTLGDFGRSGGRAFLSVGVGGLESGGGLTQRGSAWRGERAGRRRARRRAAAAAGGGGAVCRDSGMARAGRSRPGRRPPAGAARAGGGEPVRVQRPTHRSRWSRRRGASHLRICSRGRRFARRTAGRSRRRPLLAAWVAPHPTRKESRAAAWRSASTPARPSPTVQRSEFPTAVEPTPAGGGLVAGLALLAAGVTGHPTRKESRASVAALQRAEVPVIHPSKSQGGGAQRAVPAGGGRHPENAAPTTRVSHGTTRGGHHRTQNCSRRPQRPRLNSRVRRGRGAVKGAAVAGPGG